MSLNSFYSFVLENIILKIGDSFFNSNYVKSLKIVRTLVNLDENNIHNYQKDRLSKILNIATTKSEYYKGLGISKEEDVYLWIKKFPILEKKNIRKNSNLLLTVRSKSKLIKNSTSGSTGLQTEVYVSKKEQSIYRAIQTVWWEWAGYKLGFPMIQMGLATQRSFEKKLKDYFFRIYYLFAFSISKDIAKKSINWKGKREVFLGGYASALYVYSQKIAEINIKVKFRSVISWGDKLFDHYKKHIEKTFQCKIYETYGAAEGLLIAAQKDLEYMYIMSPFVYLEIVDKDGVEVQDGELGYVVVTSLIAENMPLIRYKIGDLAIKLPKEKYPLRRKLNLPLLQKVVGRETDLVITPSGKKLIVHSFTGILEYFPQIEQFCIIQNDTNGILLNYIKSNGYSLEIEREIKHKLLELINEPFNIQFVEVEQIKPTNSGKPQLIISNLKDYKI